MLGIIRSETTSFPIYWNKTHGICDCTWAGPSALQGTLAEADGFCFSFCFLVQSDYMYYIPAVYKVYSNRPALWKQLSAPQYYASILRPYMRSHSVFQLSDILPGTSPGITQTIKIGAGSESTACAFLIFDTVLQNPLSNNGGFCRNAVIIQIIDGVAHYLFGIPFGIVNTPLLHRGILSSASSTNKRTTPAGCGFLLVT